MWQLCVFWEAQQQTPPEKPSVPPSQTQLQMTRTTFTCIPPVGLNHTQPRPKPLQHDTLLAPPSQVQWPRAGPQGLSDWGLNFESRSILRSWGSSPLSYHPWPWGISSCFEVLAIWWIGATTTRPCFVLSLFDLWVSSLTALLLCVSICTFI